jgi:rare lipoprotein A
MRITAGAWMRRNADKSVNGITGQMRPRLRAHYGSRQVAALIFSGCLTLFATGCHHKKQQAYAPVPPPLRSYPSHPGTQHGEANHNSAAINRPPPRGPVTQPEGKPIFVETGMASWYGPSGHRSADGSAYDGKSMTAAHKTLPLGTVARVTNLVNGESVMVRITDRGPFSHGRVLDLSESAAKQIDLYRMGVAKVKIEAYANVAASSSGRWCVQTGAFKREQDALALKSALTRRYSGSRVNEFAGATGYWVRIDPVHHDHADAAAIMDWIGSPDPNAVPYLVRVD